MFIRTPNAQPVPGDVRLTGGVLERFGLPEGWSTDALAFQGPWNELQTYESGAVVEDVHDVPGLWVLVDPAADRWSMLAWPTREDE